ncbi:MAG TPA: ABC transporter substrate-binding protein [Ottowia sp.]|mgnify:FL=1|nr:MAG: ABC transporter permease [Burkholderiaceae bacterium]HNE59951.1 ABC transporter substrate-binding protein [Ottowia sp.]HNI85785.1 ABC transporter substrate-binding protein [Ottowia sp.]HNJ46361.1 ABC transporter substrate-binding protein [Ottowia sp.]HNK53899.1 ABC transporter substrate-binding protein [Ottowia sp.]
MSGPLSFNRRRFHAVLGASLVACSGLARAQDARLVLGQSAAFSGPAMQLGTQFHAGAKLHFDQLNARGGVNGRQIEIRHLDDGYEPDRCKANTERLIRDEVLALFGYIGTPTSLAALPLATAAKLPFIAPFSGAMGLREPFHREAFHLRASYDDETELIVRQLTVLGQNRIAVFHQNDAYGQAGLSGVTKALAARQLKPLATATVERNSADVREAVARLAQSGAQAIVQIGAYQACAAFIREARKAGYGGNFYNVSFVGTQALADELGKDGAGVAVSQVVPSPYDAARPITREFVAATRQTAGKVQANYSSMEGYLAAKVFAEGLRRAGAKPTRDALITALESINEDFGGFRVAFGPGKHVASHFAELSMLTGDGRVRT